MLIIEKKKKHGIDFREVWYADRSCDLPGINVYRGAAMPIGRELNHPRTLITDLQRPLDEIQGEFRKNCRYEIRRAQREGVECSFDISPSDEAIQGFCRFFVDFWHSKGMEDEGFEKYYEELSIYAGANALAITRALDAEGDLMVYHTYIMGEDFVRFYQSASVFRTDKQRAALTGMANRLLHLKDMEFFKERGVAVYDWGGAGQREEVQSISDFKESFGGREHFYYDSEEVLGARASVVKGMINIAGRL